MKSKLGYVIAIIFLLTFTYQGYAQQTDFSAIWKINIDKSEFGKNPTTDVPKLIDLKLNVDTLYSSTINNRPDVPMLKAILTRYPLNGNIVRKILVDGTTVDGFFKMSTDKKELNKSLGYTTTTHTEHPSLVVTQTWSVSEDNETLVISSTFKPCTREAYYIKAVYTRQ